MMDGVGYHAWKSGLVNRFVNAVLSDELSQRVPCVNLVYPDLLVSRGHIKKRFWVKCGVMALRLIRPRSA